MRVSSHIYFHIKNIYMYTFYVLIYLWDDVVHTANTSEETISGECVQLTFGFAPLAHSKHNVLNR